MSLFLTHQLHKLLRMERKNRATSRERAYPKRYWKIVVPPLLLLILVWGTLSASRQLPMSQGLFATTVSASGLLQSPVYNLTFRNPLATYNVISEIDVTQGEYVRQGQVLARLDAAFFQRNVDAAQAAVIVTQEHLNVSLARQARAIKESQALLAEAEANFHAAQATLHATSLQAQASIAEAQATLTSDQRILVAVQQQAKTQIQAGQAQAAKVAVTTAEAQVTKDRAAIAQVSTTAKLAVTNAQGQVAITWAHVLVATYDPDLLVAAQDVAQAREGLTVALEQLQTAQLYLTTNTVLLAPGDGIVTAINGTVGSLPGIRTNIAPRGISSADTSVFIQLVDLSHVNQLLLNINETDIMKVKVGQHVQFTLKAYADRQFSGIVSAISPNGVYIENAMTYPVIVSIAPESMKGVTLFPNMTTATVSIAVG